MIFGFKVNVCASSNFSLQIDGNEIKRVYCAKFLGVHVDSSLNWKTHAYQISLKVSKTMGVLILSTNLHKLLYNTFVQPYFTYCNMVWGSASKFVAKRLVVLQKRAIHLFLNRITYSSY